MEDIILFGMWIVWFLAVLFFLFYEIKTKNKINDKGE
jgi:hypothetical protein